MDIIRVMRKANESMQKRPLCTYNCHASKNYIIVDSRHFIDAFDIHCTCFDQIRRPLQVESLAARHVLGHYGPWFDFQNAFHDACREKRIVACYPMNCIRQSL